MAGLNRKFNRGGTSSTLDKSGGLNGASSARTIWNRFIFDFHMKPDSIKSPHVWSSTLKSLAVGLCVFCLGSVFAVWLTVHNVHGFLAFFDDVVAGLVAGILVLL
jgi:cation transporter-like permease